MDTICFGPQSEFVGCLNNATIGDIYPAPLTVGNTTCYGAFTVTRNGTIVVNECVPLGNVTSLPLGGVLAGTTANASFVCTGTSIGDFGYPNTVNINVGCDGRIYNISNGPAALTVNTTFGGVVVGPYNNLQFANISGLPSNWTVGSQVGLPPPLSCFSSMRQTCIPTIDGNGQGFVTGFACNNFTITGLTNSTVIVNVPHETTVMTNGSVITIGTVQPIDVTSSPTFATLKLNNYNVLSPGITGFQVTGGAEFDGGGGTTPWTFSSPAGGTNFADGLYPAIQPVIIAGTASTGTYGPFANQNVPTIVFSPSSTRTTLTLSSLNPGNSYMAFDMAYGVIATGFATWAPAWLTTTPGVVGYAWYATGNTLQLVVGTPASLDEAMATSVQFTASPSGITVGTFTVGNNLLVDGGALVDGGFSANSAIVSTDLTVGENTLLEGTVTLSSFPANQFVTTTTGGLLTTLDITFWRIGPLPFEVCLTGDTSACYDWSMNASRIGDTITYTFSCGTECSITPPGGGLLSGNLALAAQYCWSPNVDRFMYSASSGIGPAGNIPYTILFDCFAGTSVYQIGPQGGFSAGSDYIMGVNSISVVAAI